MQSEGAVFFAFKSFAIHEFTYIPHFPLAQSVATLIVHMLTILQVGTNRQA